MSYIAKPKVAHPNLPRNKLGLTARDYEGTVSTLCAGCGHDSVTAAIIQAVFQLNIEPHMLAKMSGIGCSSKTPAYFVSSSHGFNSVHGRMPSVTTGANAANRSLTYIGVSGDGDSLSIGAGQFVHAIRRNLNMCYIIENNGVYGLTKGQFSASADVGSKPKKGEPNEMEPIDPVSVALALGATYVARSFSGDREQLVPLIKGALTHKGFALVDVISPCVTFNDHEGSTKSYKHTRQFYHHVVDADFVPPAAEIKAAYEEGSAMPVELHDGSKIVLRKVDKAYDPTSRAAAFSYLRDRVNAGEIITGLLYIDGLRKEMHEVMGNTTTPLCQLPLDGLHPGAAELKKIISRYR
ncbi:MAG: 2-oxoacid:ferredoxin oxidoreductase subunit beta [Proteobacteria bacterium]|nr:2-oxoacid:ferredoxin oxidoreductase subunit beta [Pseudomonadota bacterium]MDA1064480.1 2-oxoacid:ferredoxin oxidoreductase subunit beta [Pseudomonadota bacterium]